MASASMEDIELLLMAGKPLLGEERFLDLLGGKLPKDYSWIRIGGRRMFVVGNPSGLYDKVRTKVGFKKVLDYLPFEVEV